MIEFARSALALTALSAAALYAAHAHACSCSGQGPASALTRPDQSWGVRGSERVLAGYGEFDAHGRYTAFSDADHDRTLEYDLLAAVRIRRWELSAAASYGVRSVDIFGESGHGLGLGDTSLRARYEVFDQPAFWQDGVYPALALLAAVDFATGHGAGIAPRGLGANELVLGANAERSFAERWRAGLVLQGALRMPDEALGVARQLGPRASAEATLSYFARSDLVLSALVSVRWEANVALRGQTQTGTAQRWSELGAAISWQPWTLPFRAGFAERYTPSLSELGANTVALATSELWLAYVR